ncbi:hypothetical protein F5050DRAFT_1812489 [Lentinula boryana]|uniref:DUF6534 domain-containing protein n=1 Tax=Lentinula boryana TaxID=40481 RepID=A0ABQ8Q0X6_9AGAR|nr:hypothetical protein F5050DRAFT_1812489 [Lentinula boryana]
MAVEITIDNSLGALFIGLIIASVLNGVTYSQAWFYFSAQSREHSDPQWLKLTVVTVVSIDLLHQLFTSQWLYYYCVTNFANEAALNTIPWSYYVSRAFPGQLTHTYGSNSSLPGDGRPDDRSAKFNQGINTIIVQTFYIWRVWKLSKSLILPGVLWSVCLAQFGLLLCELLAFDNAVIESSEYERIPDYVYRVSGLTSAAEFSTVMGPYAIATNGTGTAADILIAAAMVYLLQQARSSIKRTNNVLRSVTIFTVTTGILTSVCAIFVLAMAAAYPGTNIEVTFYFILARLYSNSFLATLNVRDHMRDRSHSGGVITTSDFQVHPRTNHSAVLTTASHELENFPRQKTQMDDRSGELETVISVKVDRITDRDYK